MKQDEAYLFDTYLHTPADYTLRHNHFVKPEVWKNYETQELNY